MLGVLVSAGAAICLAPCGSALSEWNLGQAINAVTGTRLLAFAFPFEECFWFYAAAGNALCLLLCNGSYTSPLTHKRCSNTASFLAVATMARFFPLLPPRDATARHRAEDFLQCFRCRPHPLLQLDMASFIQHAVPTVAVPQVQSNGQLLSRKILALLR